MKNFKIHLIYWLLLIITSAVIYMSQNWQKFFFPETEGGIELMVDIDLIDPRSGSVVGSLKSGLVLSYPNFDELHGCNVDGHASSGHERFKMLVNLETALLTKSKNVDEGSISSCQVMFAI
ncbi:MAG: hypothetical protein WBM27_00160 [bacterium]